MPTFGDEHELLLARTSAKIAAEYAALAPLQKGTLLSTDARRLKRVSGLGPTATLDSLV